MKTRILILFFIITTLGVIPPYTASLRASEIGSPALPSDQYLNTEGYIFSRGSEAARDNSISMYSGTFAIGDAWEDPIFPGGGSTWPGNVGGPIGDVTPVVVILLILAYFVFRNVTISRRKNL